MSENVEKVYRSELTPVSFLRRAAYMFPEHTAVVHGERRYTYRELEERVNRLASRLREAGIGKGERVAFLLPNIPPMLEAHFALPAAGVVLVAINTRLSAGEVDYILKHSNSRMVFVDRELEHLVEGAGIEKVRVDDTGEAGDPYEDYLAGGSPAPVESVLADEEETISINYTSGTTGRPKGVMYTHRGAYLSALGNVIEAGMDYRTKYLWTLPMFHCNGWTFPWAVTAIAGTHVCLRKVEAPRIWASFESEGITHYCAAPTVQISIVNAEEAKPLDVHVRAMIAGAPPSPTLLSQLSELNIDPVHIYGLTETYGPITTSAPREEWKDLPADERAALMARQGQAYVTADLARVVDDNGDDIEQGTGAMGEIVFRGNMVMKGYLDNEEATAEAFEGGWYHTGDVALWHDDGYIEIRDRSKDVIISGGENISTIEVEQAIAKHEAVLEAAVVAIPDERWGERPKAFVTLKKGKEATEEEIIAFCKEKIARYKAPAAVDFVEELPKTSTGKIQKYVLREKEWSGREKQVN
ncbi:acyl--CoA ligase family protein [Rubrobacter radiotolerans]|uniref:Acyl--CoA ligase family protein n=1 Tax=Rubrobacter radiotolerans TaxID=42256 RepID=A0AB35T3R2_RUBRA|nr:acyl--CoA ligase family protein [Rubrobacter radiotolerans]MDX5894519.1 acyl--CoA ligase family protein [Rubrobacter radiotolerans]SMC06176.1 fatty-acyl-CoA synthase [Rubrobacter radiotolerans DSM 5868]